MYNKYKVFIIYLLIMYIYICTYMYVQGLGSINIILLLHTVPGTDWYKYVLH